jgi:hypothetical protein
VWGIPQSHLLPVQVPANSRGTDPYRQTARGNEVTPTCFSHPGAARQADNRPWWDCPRSEGPRESLGIRMRLTWALFAVG